MKKLSCSNCVFDNPSLLSNIDNSCSSKYEGRTKVKFLQGELIYSQGSKTDGIYCISKGKVKIVKLKKEQHEFVLWYAEPGEVIGIDSVINNTSHYTSAIAAEDCELCYVSNEDFHLLISSSQGAAMDFIKILCSKIDFIEGRFINLVSRTIRSRLAEQILQLLIKKNEGREMPVKEIPFDADEIAGIIGTSKNYLYKVMAKFAKDGILKTRMNKLKVLDHNKLLKEATGI